MFQVEKNSGSDFVVAPRRSRNQSRRRDSKGRKVTDEEIAEYLARKAHKKASNPFVWRKKIVRDVIQGVSIDEFSKKAEKKRQRERMDEIEKVKRRREERAVEKAHHEEEMAVLARERARAEFHDWEKKEQEFLFNQSKARSEIRVTEGRAKPIDILAKHLDYGIQLNEPYIIFKGLTLKQIQELRDEIKMHLDLDRATDTRIRYWEALFVVSEWELAEARRQDTLHAAVPGQMIGEERGLHSSIEPEVKNFFHGKTYDALDTIQYKIESLMRSGNAKVVEYWEAVLKRLHVYKAKACLRKHLEYLEEDNKKERSPEFDRQVIEGNNEPEALPVPVVMEAAFGTEINLDYQMHWWHDKYFPRKPKYFNRVHIGYEWNKYNRTHYDHDNPPPNAVQGYKFNIFYPDLVHKSIAPDYTIDRDGDETETCIIRFHAGPPYEDIAFKIVNKKWECKHKKGFKCTFERGILQLYFNFERYHYRR